MGCHTIMGEGAYYAPELTNVIERRGEEYVRAISQVGFSMATPWKKNGSLWNERSRGQ